MYFIVQFLEVPLFVTRKTVTFHRPKMTSRGPKETPQHPTRLTVVGLETKKGEAFTFPFQSYLPSVSSPDTPVHWCLSDTGGCDFLPSDALGD